MLRKFVGLTLMASMLVSTVLYQTEAIAATLTMQKVYNYAQAGKTKELMAYIQYGYSVDVKDDDGNTALCYAISQGNTAAVKRLISLGANRKAECISEFSDEELKKVGLVRRSAGQTGTHYKSKDSSGIIPAVWKTNTVLGLGIIGGAVAIIAASGGGGGGGGGGGFVSNPKKDDEKTTLDEVKTIDAIPKNLSSPCPKGMEVIEGVCTCPKGKIEINDTCTCPKGTIEINGTCKPEIEGAEYPKFAEFGKKIFNNETINIEVSEDETKPVVAMQAKGVGDGALSGSKVYLSKASSATNSGSIEMIETSPDNGGVIGMYGASAGTINNDGEIKITSMSAAVSAAMMVYYKKDDIGLPGTGKNITNNGKITVSEVGDGMGTLSAISAPGRGVTNNGTINLNLNTTAGGVPVDSESYGIMQGIYGKNIVNKGTINLSTESENAINSYAYLMRGIGDKGTIVANDGTLNIKLTNVAWGIHGVWSDKGTNVAIKNTGDVNVTGTLYSPAPFSKQDYFVGSNSGISTVLNTGKIQVGHADDPTIKDPTDEDGPIDVSAGGIMDAMYLSSGTMTNKGIIDFHLKTDPTKNSDMFTAFAMQLDNGTLINDNYINYTFSNKTADEYTGTKPEICLTAISVGEGSATNNGEIIATIGEMSEVESEEETEEKEMEKTTFARDGFYTAMNANTGNLTNTKQIRADSYVDNVDLIGLKSNGGSITNTEMAVIDMYTNGENANLIGGDSNSISINAKSSNSGYVFLTHDGGSGNITGFSGTNTGLIQIRADNMTGISTIKGGKSYTAVSEKTSQTIDEETKEELEDDILEEEGSTAELPTKAAAGKINIAVTGTVGGEISGFDYLGEKDEEKIKHTSASTINIGANDKNRENDLTVYGLYTEKGRDAASVETSRDGILNVDVTANPSTKTNVYGLYAKDASITNKNTSVVNLDVNLNGSTNHFIAGMVALDTSVADEMNTFRGGYKALNEGTININVHGEGATTSYIDSDVPFDVVGMLTNSYAINTGTINLNVAESGTAKTAGMVAYDGGTVINQGVIRFTGIKSNFTPLYATGQNHSVVMEYDEAGEPTKRTTTDYYATLYNSGKIVINKEIPGEQYTPQGSGYYSSSNLDTEHPRQVITGDTIYDNVTAKDWEIEVPDEEEEDGWRTDEKGSTRRYFTLFDNPLETESENDGESKGSKTMMAAAPKSKGTEGETTLNPTENVMESVNNALAENVNAEMPTETKSAYTMRLNDGMRYVSEAGGSIIADGIHLLGSVTAGTSLVTGNNKDSYVATGFGDGAVVSDGDSSDLALDSNSAMFKASYAKNATNKNGLDIVMTRKNFNEIVENSSLASFLENNYQSGNNVAFFDRLKAFSNMAGLTDSLNKLTGAGILSRFNFEDMTMMRELNFNMNEQLFHNKEGSFSVAGIVAPMAFKGDLGSKSKYSLFNKKKGNMSIGLGIAFSDIKSDDEHKDSGRHESVYQMIVPIGFKVLGFNLMTSPRIGYARGKYDREGFNNMNYDGTIEKRVYGLMNEARYPIDFGDWTIEPAAEFNVLGYTQKGKEDAKDYSLNIKSQNTYSIESGIGLYFLKDKDIGKDRHLKFNAGIAVYHEFADPYKIDVGMRGMDGSFQLRDEKRSDNRGVLRLGLDYENKDYTLYGSFMSYIDKEVRTNFKSGVKVKF